MKFTPAPVKKVRFIDENGKVIKIVQLNRKERRRLGIK